MKCRIETGKTFAKMARRRLCMSQRLYMVSVSESWHENTSGLSAGQICMDISVSTKAVSPLCKRQWTAKNLKDLQIRKRLEVYDAAAKEASLWEWKLYSNKLDCEAIKQFFKLSQRPEAVFQHTWIRMVGSTVASQVRRSLVRIPAKPGGLSVWSVHVLPVSVWVVLHPNPKTCSKGELETLNCP